MIKTIIVLVYLGIGLVVASIRDYMGNVNDIGDIINLVLAVVLWPLVLLGVKFNLDIGGDDKKGDKNGDGNKNGALVMVGGAATYARAWIATRRAA